MTFFAGVNRGHNASVALLKDGEIVFHLENERLSNIKYDWYAFGALSKIREYTDGLDGFAVAGLCKTVPADSYIQHDLYTTFVRNQTRSFFEKQMAHADMGLLHHQTHAATAFYNSGFEKALCIITDGMGSDYEIVDPRFSKGSYGREKSSVFIAEYPNKFELVEKTVVVPIDIGNVKIDEKVTVNGNPSEAFAFSVVCNLFKWHGMDGGKVMGMSSYGKPDSRIPKIYNSDGNISREVFDFADDLHKGCLNLKDYPVLGQQDFQTQANFALALQASTQDHIAKYILRMIEKTGIKDVCLSGGYFLNCVANYHILRQLPKDVRLYVEPISSDAGTSLGAAKLLWHSITQDKTIRKLNDLYLGPEYHYELSQLKDYLLPNETLHENVSVDEIASIIADKNLIAMYQGRSESGPRALGNRSFLYDPRDPNGKDEVNKIKKREWFRPFAGTVLYEHRNEWFDLHTMNESPFMMYAVNVKKDGVPAITHVDKTCRVQTLKKEQNANFYNLIDAFYRKTNVPILLNTSLNLAGDCIVETLGDAIEVIRNSEVKYLYLPDLKCLITK